MFDTLLALIAPHICIGCAVEGDLWCGDCRRDAPAAIERCYRCHALSVAGRTCPSCRRASALYQVQAATAYEGGAKRLIWKLKFERARAGARDAAALIAVRCTIPEEVVLVHVPTATSRVRRRGYDQAWLVARSLARRLGTPARPWLLRLGQKQQRGASRRGRLQQLDGAFMVQGVAAIRGKHVVLVDDVVTTGATLEAAARTLKAAGAKRVSAVVFAQA